MLSNDRRRHVNPNGTLTISEVESRDAGNYSCTARNEDGVTAQEYLQVEVVSK